MKKKLQIIKLLPHAEEFEMALNHERGVLRHSLTQIGEEVWIPPGGKVVVTMQVFADGSAEVTLERG